MHRTTTTPWRRTLVPHPPGSVASLPVCRPFVRNRWVRWDRSHPLDSRVQGAVLPFRRLLRRPISTDSTESPGPATVQVQDPTNEPDDGATQAAAITTQLPAQDATEEERIDAFALKELWQEIKDPTTMGKRGEGWFIAQVLAVLLILFPPIRLQGLLDAAGAIAVGMGVVFIAYAVSHFRAV